MLTTISAVMLMAIMAGMAVAEDTPPVADVPTVTLPTDTTPDPAEQPAVPVAPVPVAPLPVTGAPVRTLLIKRVREQLVKYVMSARRWHGMVGGKPLPSVNIWNLGTPEAGHKLLSKWQERSRQLHAAAKQLMRKRIIEFRANVEHQRLVMGLKPNVRTLATSGNLELRYQRMKRLAITTYRQYAKPPHKSQFFCIHGYEGSWTANTGNGYYGGLQMDLTFQSGYGGYLLSSKGTADRWSPLEQIWVAERAVVSRGFHPWPNTARYCGLL